MANLSKSRRKKSQRQKFLDDNPACYFCDGANRATTVDHVPPRSCFPDGHAPEGLEFPACKACNEGATKQDQIFGFYTMVVDFDKWKMRRPEDVSKLNKLKQGILNNYPDALPDERTAIPIYRTDLLYTLSPIAVSVETPPAMKEAAEVMGRKRTHALYLRESGKRLSRNHSFVTWVYQPQSHRTETLTSYFMSLLSKQAGEPSTRESIWVIDSGLDAGSGAGAIMRPSIPVSSCLWLSSRQWLATRSPVSRIFLGSGYVARATKREFLLFKRQRSRVVKIDQMLALKLTV